MTLIPQSPGYDAQSGQGPALPRVDAEVAGRKAMTDSRIGPGGGRMLRKLALISGALLMVGAMTLPARADLKLCNNTESRVGVALARLLRPRLLRLPAGQAL